MPTTWQEDGGARSANNPRLAAHSHPTRVAPHLAAHRAHRTRTSRRAHRLLRSAAIAISLSCVAKSRNVLSDAFTARSLRQLAQIWPDMARTKHHKAKHGQGAAMPLTEGVAEGGDLGGRMLARSLVLSR